MVKTFICELHEPLNCDILAKAVQVSKIKDWVWVPMKPCKVTGKLCGHI